MRMFSFDPGDLADTYASRGWAHIRHGATPEFVEHLREYHRRHAAPGAVLHGTGIQGAKEQLLYEPPPEVDLLGELRTLVHRMCGLDPEGFTLAERHVKMYSPDADPAPVAHKDRLASQVSIGVSIDIPEPSRLVIYPDVHREVNPFLTGELIPSLAPRQRPEMILPDAPAVEIADRPGDVTLFAGSSTWHLRRHSAGAVLLYLKCNDFNSDPLGEDPTTELRHRSTVALLGEPDPEAWAQATAVVARRLEWVGRVRGRDGVVRPFAKLWDRPPTLVSESDLVVLERLDAGGAVRADAGGARSAEAVEALVRLARLGLVDLVGAAEHPVADTAHGASAPA